MIVLTPTPNSLSQAISQCTDGLFSGSTNELRGYEWSAPQRGAGGSH